MQLKKNLLDIEAKGMAWAVDHHFQFTGLASPTADYPSIFARFTAAIDALGLRTHLVKIHFYWTKDFKGSNDLYLKYHIIQPHISTGPGHAAGSYKVNEDFMDASFGWSVSVASGKAEAAKFGYRTQESADMMNSAFAAFNESNQKGAIRSVVGEIFSIPFAPIPAGDNANMFGATGWNAIPAISKDVATYLQSPTGIEQFQQSLAGVESTQIAIETNKFINARGAYTWEQIKTAGFRFAHFHLG
jgi:hypothetical protein